VAFTEERLFAEVAGWTVSGQFDRMLLFPDGTLQDYKFTSVWAVPDGCKPEWERQLNALRYLAACNGYRIARLQIVAILRDWSKGKAKRGGAATIRPGEPRRCADYCAVASFCEQRRAELAGREQVA